MLDFTIVLLLLAPFVWAVWYATKRRSKLMLRERDAALVAQAEIAECRRIRWDQEASLARAREAVKPKPKRTRQVMSKSTAKRIAAQSARPQAKTTDDRNSDGAEGMLLGAAVGYALGSSNNSRSDHETEAFTSGGGSFGGGGASGVWDDSSSSSNSGSSGNSDSSSSGDSNSSSD
jgi:hypothetical protein